MPLPKSDINCPMDSVLKLLMGQWTCYIIWMFVNKGPMRFGELKRMVEGISAKVLTERLRMLEYYGIIYREAKPTSPPEVTYGLTARGEELTTVLVPLYDMACRWEMAEATENTEETEGSATSKSPELLSAMTEDFGHVASTEEMASPKITIVSESA